MSEVAVKERKQAEREITGEREREREREREYEVQCN
jgi:hypothetical protein